MISIARTLGAPERVPAGKVARSASEPRRPAARRPTTELSMCITWL